MPTKRAKPFGGISLKRLRELARENNIQGRSKMNRDELVQHLRPILQNLQDEAANTTTVLDNKAKEEAEAQKKYTPEGGQDVYDPLLVQANRLPSHIWGSEGESGEHIRPVGDVTEVDSVNDLDEEIGGGIDESGSLTAD